ASHVVTRREILLGAKAQWTPGYATVASTTRTVIEDSPANESPSSNVFLPEHPSLRFRCRLLCVTLRRLLSVTRIQTFLSREGMLMRRAPFVAALSGVACFAFLVAWLAVPSTAQQNAPRRAAAAQLPISQVVLFSSGVGFFLREG